MIVGTLGEAAEAMRGRLLGGDSSFAGVSTDTRCLAAGELFFALRGPNFDGHAFVDAAASHSAAGAVVSSAVDTTLARIEVDDTLTALGDLAGGWRRRMPARVIGLTGSNGKTTLKEMIASCLARLAAGELFFALRGPNFDGHGFVDAAAAGSAAGAVVSSAVDTTLARIEVDDTLTALGDLAGDWRRRMPARVIGLTGSNGKTTLKEMIASCLSRVASTVATEGNLNNEIGVPLMLLRIAPEHEFAVIEMGANHIGEIGRLTRRAAPDVVAITNAGAAHLEGFGGIDGVARGKGEILCGSPRPDVAVLNADDAYFEYWSSLADDVRIVSFGESDSATVRAIDIEPIDGGLHFDLRLPTTTLHIELPLPGRHNAVNAAAAAAVALALDVSPEAIREGLNTTRPVSGRLRAVAGIGGTRIYDDSYNANPESVRAAAEYLGTRGGAGWLVLGDMAELGPDADRLHEEVGAAARAAGVARLFVTGRHAPAVVAGFGEGAVGFESVEDLVAGLREAIAVAAPGSLLVKGSRSARMERVVSALVDPNADRAGA